MSKDFNQVITIEKAKTAQEKEANKITLENITKEELDAMVERVENFHGTTAHLANTERYHRLRDTAKWLMTHQDGIVAWGELPVNPESRNAQVWLDFSAVTFMNGKDANAFRMIADLADCVWITLKQGEDCGIRMTFVVKNVMEA